MVPSLTTPFLRVSASINYYLIQLFHRSSISIIFTGIHSEIHLCPQCFLKKREYSDPSLSKRFLEIFDDAMKARKKSVAEESCWVSQFVV